MSASVGAGMQRLMSWGAAARSMQQSVLGVHVAGSDAVAELLRCCRASRNMQQGVHGVRASARRAPAAVTAARAAAAGSCIRCCCTRQQSKVHPHRTHLGVLLGCQALKFLWPG